MGSVLVEEMALREQRINATSALSGGRVSPELLFKTMKHYASLNQRPYQMACKELHLKCLPWRSDLGLETLRPKVPETLLILKEHFRIGLIANQPLGTEERLRTFGIADFFDEITASAEEGLEKPNLEIFRRALKRANTTPDVSLMVGDRLDNDIAPAMELGLFTAWVKHDMGSFGDVDLLPKKPDFSISGIEELPLLLGIKSK